MKRIFLIFLLFAVAVSANPSLEFDKDRIEAGKPFQMMLVVPKRELSASRSVPRLSTTNGFVLNGIDSADGQAPMGFFDIVDVRRYIFKLTAPAKTGRLQIGVLSWTVQGQEYELSRPAVNVQRSFDEGAVEIALTPSKRTVYQGEQLSVTLGIHTYENFAGQLQAVSMDLGSDFIVHRADISNLQFNRVANTAEMTANAKFAWLSPVRTGSLKVPAFRFKYMKVGAPKVVEQHKNSAGFSMSFKSIQQQNEEAETSSSPIVVNVLPLPEKGKPADFTGMVGNYSMNIDLDRNDLKVGEAVTLTLTLKGDGTPGTVTDPKLPDFNDFRTVPPETNLEKTVEGAKVMTVKTTKIFLYPKAQGKFTIPAIAYNWFNPASRRYQEVSLGPWTVNVAKGDSTLLANLPQATGPAGAQKEDIETLGSDIRYIHSVNDASQASTPLFERAGYWALFVLPILLYFIFCAFIRRYRKNSSNAALVRKAKARKNLKTNTDAAMLALEKDDGKAFYAALENGLVGYLSDLSNLEFRGMTREQREESLRALGFKDAQVEEISKWFDTCAFARFAPVVQSEAERKDALSKFETLCETLEVLK